MPVPLSYPGVYIEEIPSGVRTIVGVSTAVTAFLGAAARGSLDDPVKITSFAEFERRFGGLSPASTMSYAVRHFFANDGREAVIIRIANEAKPATITVGTTGNELHLRAASPGRWGADITATVDYEGLPNDETKVFHLTLQDGADAREQYFNLSVDPNSPRFVTEVLKGSALAQVDVGQNDPVPTRRPEYGDYTATDGSDGDAPTADHYRGSEAGKTGLYALEKTPLFNLLCIPPPTRDGATGDTVYQEALAYCQKRRAVLLVDPRPDWTNNNVEAELKKLNLGGSAARNAAFYFPRLTAADPLAEDRSASFVPCGAIAGVIARTDATRGVWKAPAGIDAAIAGIRGPSIGLTDDENGGLNPRGINCLRTFPTFGTVVWGARTLRGDDRAADGYKYLPVRRTALFIEESLYQGTQWVVFEPNDEPLWAQIRLNVGAFLHTLFRQGAFQGTTPREAYFVRCDKTTTTQADVDQGIVNVVVGFAPLKPAEFVVIRLQQMAGQTAA